VQKSLKQFCEEKAAELTGKKLGLFLSCGFPENLEQNMSNSFPEALLESAVAKVCFGGELRIDRMKFIHRTITNMMKKAGAKSGKKDAIPMPENIAKLAEAMNA
jgi:menaquinone-dependent protoporphyrinogen oxidase